MSSAQRSSKGIWTRANCSLWDVDHEAMRAFMKKFNGNFPRVVSQIVPDLKMKARPLLSPEKMHDEPHLRPIWTVRMQSY